jgi:hypothetical protein
MQIQGRYFEQGVSSYVSQTAEETKQIAAGPGKLFTLDVVNVSGATIYVYLFDSLTAANDILIPPVKIAAGELMSLEYGGALVFETALFIAASSTQSTYTATTTDDLMIRAVYKS